MSSRDFATPLLLRVAPLPRRPAVTGGAALQTVLLAVVLAERKPLDGGR